MQLPDLPDGCDSYLVSVETQSGLCPVRLLGTKAAAREMAFAVLLDPDLYVSEAVIDTGRDDMDLFEPFGMMPFPTVVVDGFLYGRPIAHIKLRDVDSGPQAVIEPTQKTRRINIAEYTTYDAASINHP